MRTDEKPVPNWPEKCVAHVLQSHHIPVQLNVFESGFEMDVVVNLSRSNRVVNIEVDGFVHKRPGRQNRDAFRDSWLQRERGIDVIRLDVEGKSKGDIRNLVIECIKEHDLK